MGCDQVKKRGAKHSKHGEQHVQMPMWEDTSYWKKGCEVGTKICGFNVKRGDFIAEGSQMMPHLTVLQGLYSRAMERFSAEGQHGQFGIQNRYLGI